MRYLPVLFVGIVLATALPGCSVIPAGLKIAALAGSGVSLATTGKTLPDHALSSVTERDCRITRLVNGRKICADAAVDAPAATEGKTTRFASQSPSRYAIIGSFTDAGNARNWGARFPEFAPQVMRVEHMDRALYRVAVGPIAYSATAMLSDQFVLAGIENTWFMTVCAPAAAPAGCESRVASL